MEAVEGRDQSWVEVCVATWKKFCNRNETMVVVSPVCQPWLWRRQRIGRILTPGGLLEGGRMGTPRGKRSLEQRGRDTDGYTLIQRLDIQEHGRQRPIRWGLRNRTLPSALGTCRTHCYIPSPSSQSRRPQSSVIWVPTPACRAQYLLCPLPQSCPLRALTGRPRQKRHRFLLLCRELPGGRQGVLSTLQMLQSSLLIECTNACLWGWEQHQMAQASHRARGGGRGSGCAGLGCWGGGDAGRPCFRKSKALSKFF